VTNAYGYAERDTEQALRNLRKYIIEKVKGHVSEIYRLLATYKRSLRRDRINEQRQSDYILTLLDEIQNFTLALEYLEKQVNE